MTESVYTNQTDKFALIVRTLKDIHDLNVQLDNHAGFKEYTHSIACAHRTCGLGIDFWSSICMNSLKACERWDTLKALPTNDFLNWGHFKPLHLKLAALRIMLDNFKTTADDTRDWKLANDRLEIIDPADENPVIVPRIAGPRHNPISYEHIHHGNPGDPNHGHPDAPDPVDAMLGQLEKYI